MAVLAAAGTQGVDPTAEASGIGDHSHGGSIAHWYVHRRLHAAAGAAVGNLVHIGFDGAFSDAQLRLLGDVAHRADYVSGALARPLRAALTIATTVSSPIVL